MAAMSLKTALTFRFEMSCYHREPCQDLASHYTRVGAYLQKLLARVRHLLNLPLHAHLAASRACQ
eukprot:3799933-Rhodomonas_salina.1